jgi:hypothetical protein
MYKYLYVDIYIYVYIYICIYEYVHINSNMLIIFFACLYAGYLLLRASAEMTERCCKDGICCTTKECTNESFLDCCNVQIDTDVLKG